MSNSGDRAVSRRAVLGGVAAGVAGAGLAPGWAAYGDSGAAHGGAAHGAGGRPSKPVDQDSIDAVASRLDRDLIELRRDIHRHPETAGQERRTANVVAWRLRAAGLDVTTGVGGYGVVGVLTGG
jgi:hypothetical protein